MFQELLLASCFVVVWILSSISSIFGIMSFGDRTIYHPNKLFTDVANTGHREGIQGMRKLKMGTKLNQDPIIIHEWNGHLAIFFKPSSSDGKFYTIFASPNTYFTGNSRWVPQ